MTRKIEITSIERAVIVAALYAYGYEGTLAKNISDRFDHADPANDGPEVEILSHLRAIE
jgi:hypothetical protein